MDGINANGEKILIIDDEPKIRRMIQIAFEARGYSIIQAGTGSEGIESCVMHSPDLVILDLGLPDMDGGKVLDRIREWSVVPVIILSVRDQEDDKVAALDAGADDYVGKPFGMSELLARVRVALRHRSTEECEPVIALGDDIIIDKTERKVTRKGNEVKLTPTEYTLLTTLASHPGRVMTHGYLLRNVWGPGYDKEMGYLRVYIAQLRHKLEDNPAEPKCILTECGVGYRTCSKA